MLRDAKASPGRLGHVNRLPGTGLRSVPYRNGEGLLGLASTAWRAVACLLAALSSSAGCRESETRDPKPPPGHVWLSPDQISNAQIQTARVEEREIERGLFTAARVAFNDQLVTHVASPVTGRVVEILAPLGARVAQGAPLASIESPDVGAVFADLDKAEADYVASRKEAERQRELYDAHATAQRDLQAAEDQFLVARAELERARKKARLIDPRSADKVTQRFILRAPIAGEVISRRVNPGEEVQGTFSGAPSLTLFTIGEFDSVWVLMEVFEMDLSEVSIGASVQVRVVAYPDRAFFGQVDWISDAIDPAVRTATVRCQLDNPDRLLKPDMYATANIALAPARGVAVPRAALMRLGDHEVVFVEGLGAPSGQRDFERRAVTVEDTGRTWVRIVHGLAAGDVVVTEGVILLAGML